MKYLKYIILLIVIVFAVVNPNELSSYISMAIHLFSKSVFYIINLLK
jgi:hypothetical protein